MRIIDEERTGCTKSRERNEAGLENEGTGWISADQHAVAVAVEAVSGFDGMAVGAQEFSCPANAATSASRLDCGRWKFVSS